MRFLMVDRLESSPSTFRQDESHRRGRSGVNPEESLVYGFTLSGRPGYSHHCTVNAHPALPSPSAHRKPVVRRPPRVRLIDTVRHRKPRESRKAGFWVSSANNPKTLGLLFPRPHQQFLTSCGSEGADREAAVRPASHWQCQL